MKYGTKFKKKRNKRNNWKNKRKAERPQRNSWFDEGCQILFEDKKKAYNKMSNRNTRHNEQECLSMKEKKHINYLDRKERIV